MTHDFDHAFHIHTYSESSHDDAIGSDNRSLNYRTAFKGIYIMRGESALLMNFP